MSMPLSNAANNQFYINNHFLHHPKVDNEGDAANLLI